MTPEPASVRLALRAEGDWWVAYAAGTETMDRATEIARIRMSVVTDDRVKDGFKALMKDALTAILTDIGAPPQSWDERIAPESERSGKA